MTATPIVRVTDDADRATLEQAIKALRLKQRRLPAYFTERREEIAEELETLVRMWLATEDPSKETNSGRRELDQ